MAEMDLGAVVFGHAKVTAKAPVKQTKHSLNFA